MYTRLRFPPIHNKLSMNKGERNTACTLGEYHSTAVDAVDWLGHAVFLSVHAVFLSPLHINSIIKNHYPLIIK